SHVSAGMGPARTGSARAIALPRPRGDLLVDRLEERQRAIELGTIVGCEIRVTNPAKQVLRIAPAVPEGPERGVAHRIAELAREGVAIADLREPGAEGIGMAGERAQRRSDPLDARARPHLVLLPRPVARIGVD